MKISNYLLLLVFLIGVQNCGQNQSINTSSDQTNPSSIDLKPVLEQAKKAPNLRSLLILHNNELIIEKYYDSYPKDSLDHLRSASKSFMATLIGIAIDKGFIDSVEDPITKYLGEKANKKKGIAIKHFLSMTSGLDWNEGIGYNDNNEMVESGNPFNYLMDKPIAHPPGRFWNYSTGDIHMLSYILTDATGMSTLEFANKYLFKPMGIGKKKLQKFGDGYYAGGSRIQLKPKDMIKLGQMYLNNGAFNGQQILSKQFIEAATDLQNPKGSFANNAEGFGYGYGWWVGRPMGVKGFMASGYAGQNIFVLPSLDLIVACTHDWRVSGQQAIEQQDMAETLAGLIVMELLK